MKKSIFLLFILSVSVIVNAQIITTFAGGGTMLGDGGNATSALISNPVGMAFDKKGNLYISSGVSNRIRRIDTAGIITTVAGIGIAGYTGDNGIATIAEINFPTGITIDTSDNIYFTDKQNFAIRKIDAASGIITTICGNGVQGYSGDNGPASAAQLYSPENIHFDKQGNLYIAENSKHVVRKISASGIITTIAGTGSQGYNGDGISATAALLNYPEDIETDDWGNIYISDQGNYRIRKISSSGMISTYAGNGGSTYGGDGMLATNAQFTPTFIKFDLMNNMYITGNRRVSKIDASGVFHRVTGDGSATNTGDGGLAAVAAIYDPLGLAVNQCNNLYISLRMANKIRKITFNPYPCVTLSVNEQSNKQVVSIYPNPAKEEINIEGAQPHTTYRLFNAVGSVVQHGSLKQNSNSITINHLPPGLYLLAITDEEGKRTVHKIVKE